MRGNNSTHTRLEIRISTTNPQQQHRLVLLTSVAFVSRLHREHGDRVRMLLHHARLELLHHFFGLPLRRRRRVQVRFTVRSRVGVELRVRVRVCCSIRPPGEGRERRKGRGEIWNFGSDDNGCVELVGDDKMKANERKASAVKQGRQ